MQHSMVLYLATQGTVGAPAWKYNVTDSSTWRQSCYFSGNIWWVSTTIIHLVAL